jgi:uncharacterized protein YndB with AHSA1/START domain
MTARSAAHTSFVLERRLKAAPARVFAAWADIDAKRRWADCHAEVGTIEYTMDFCVGGHEIHRATLPDGREQRVDKVFLEIVPDARIIFAYAMAAAGCSLSASLVTVEFQPDGAGTRLLLTEQLAYLDGHHDLDQRIEGTAEGLDRLVLEVDHLPV